MAPPSKTAVINSVFLFRDLIMTFPKALTGVDGIVRRKEYNIFSYLGCFTLLYVIGSPGIFIYIFLGGYRYFNPAYLILQPAIGLFVGIIPYCAFALILKNMWDRQEFTRRKNALLKYLILINIFTPITWMVFPLKYFIPTLKYHVFFPTVIISFGMFIILLRSGSSEIKKKHFVNSALPLMVVYLFLFFLIPHISEMMVRLLRF